MGIVPTLNSAAASWNAQFYFFLTPLSHTTCLNPKNWGRELLRQDVHIHAGRSVPGDFKEVLEQSLAVRVAFVTIQLSLLSGRPSRLLGQGKESFICLAA
jgi:hypothetical protein